MNGNKWDFDLVVPLWRFLKCEVRRDRLHTEIQDSVQDILQAVVVVEIIYFWLCILQGGTRQKKNEAFGNFSLFARLFMVENKTSVLRTILFLYR